MKAFMDKDFLLESDTARELFAAANEMPIFDWHCHLSPKEIYENRAPEDIAWLWLAGDHYKWRAMLANGADVSLLYGDKGSGSDWDKFYAYASMLKYAIGNPLYHWTLLELQRVFGIYDVLNEKTAKSIWDRANAMLATDEFRCRRLIEKFNVKVICTTDDPSSDLHDHIALAKDP
ncbi:MAG TPA: glucuronate isomerase, partial [Ruminococcaceae bacterium]|nr:glucuronate isomerase [Oscillospiraceae bacterium]